MTSDSVVADRPGALEQLVADGVPAEVASVAISLRCSTCGGRPTGVHLDNDGEWHVELSHASGCRYYLDGITRQPEGTP